MRQVRQKMYINLPGGNSSKNSLKEALDISSSNNKGIFLFFVAVQLYIIVTVYSTTDYQLLIPDKRILLPILGVNIPIYVFYVLTPILFCLLHGVVLFSLCQHARKLYQWNKFSRVDKVFEVNPFLYNYSIFKDNVLKIFLWGFYFTIPLICLFIIMWRFANYHFFRITLLHFVTILVDVLTIIIFYMTIKECEKDPSFRLGEKRFFLVEIWQTFWKAGVLKVMLRISTVLPIFGLAIMQLIISFSIERDKNFLPFDLQSIENKVLSKSSLLINGQHYTNLYKMIVPVIDVRDKKISVRNGPFSLLPHNGKHTDTYSAFINELPGIDFKKRDLRYGVFNRSMFLNSNFDDTLLYGASLVQSNLRGSSFVNTDLQFADLSAAEFRHAVLLGTDFRAVKAFGTKFIGGEFRQVKFYQASFKDSDFTLARFNSADLTGVNLDSCNLQFADLSHARLRGANLKNADLQGANMKGADLKGADLRGANLRGAILVDAQLDGALLHGTDVSYTCFNARSFDMLLGGDSIKRNSYSISDDAQNSKTLIIDEPANRQGTNKVKNWSDYYGYLVSQKSAFFEKEKKINRNNINDLIEKLNSSKTLLMKTRCLPVKSISFHRITSSQEADRKRLELACSDKYLAKGLLNQKLVTDKIKTHLSTKCDKSLGQIDFASLEQLDLQRSEMYQWE